ncbi:OmpA family protein [Alkalitalea saponilacus]|uniref:OmpA family protein n=1 Tax=Alkalitalea saponilacus TaxID=889453 RepID=A0A1T5AU47_9BACT|nr:OmpA family protein [Alkalitalea saponilacus]ASB48595.1 flagellar motor protein MotB [Alkalitalea saponilacus]SKB38445.1 OmpA family protein [Alkalitalea saponilacus]
MKRILLFIITLVVIKFGAYSQIDFGNLEEYQLYRPDSTYNVWSVTVGYGPVIYYTDVIDHTIFPQSNLKFGPTVQVARQFGRSWALEGQFIMADMYGQKYQRYFKGDFREASVNVKAYLNQLIMGGPMRDKWNIYGKLGLGMNFFRSAQFSQIDDLPLFVSDVYTIPSGYPTSYADWDWDNDLLVKGYDRQTFEKTSRQRELVVPIGIGVRYRLNNSFDLGVETSMRNLLADNLDVDMTGADNDSYMYTSFSVTYKIGRRNRRHSSWTYKDFNLDYQRQRARDPMIARLDSLRQQLDHLAASDSVVSDTTTIHTEKVIRRETFTASVFFGFDRSDITQRSHRTIAGVARYMKDNPDVRIRIRGYTDDRGSYEYNLGLSERRCRAVVDVLVRDYGIDESRFEVEPKGKEILLSDTRRLAPRGVHLVNRRVDIIQIFE